MTFKFGDLLRYPDDQGVGDSILFMFLAPFRHGGQTYHHVMIVRDGGDIWTPGEIIMAGREELIPYEEPGGIKIFVDGKELSDETCSLASTSRPEPVSLSTA